MRGLRASLCCIQDHWAIQLGLCGRAAVGLMVTTEGASKENEEGGLCISVTTSGNVWKLRQGAPIVGSKPPLEGT